MLFNFSHLVATLIYAAKLGSTAAIFTTTFVLKLPGAPSNTLQAANISSLPCSDTLSSVNTVATSQILPSLPLSKDTLDSLCTFLSFVVAIPDEVQQSQGSVTDFFTRLSTCIENAAPEVLSELESVTSQIGGGISSALDVASSFETRISSAAVAVVTEVHTIIGSNPSKGLQGASSVIADIENKASDAIPILTIAIPGLTSDASKALPALTSFLGSEASVLLPKASSLANDVKSKFSEAEPKASSAVGNIESKIGEGIPKVTSIIASKVGEAAPKITAAIGNFLHGIGFRRDVEDGASAVGKCLGIDTITDTAIKAAQCVVGIAGSEAAVDLVGLKVAVTTAGGVLEFVKSLSGNNLAQSGLEILNTIVELGKGIQGCDLLG